MPGRNERQVTEWLCGRYAIPYEVRDGDATIAPEVILWLELPSGALVGVTLCDARTGATVAQSFEQTTQSPLAGPPRRPERIRAADTRTANELRGAAEGIPIIVGGVSELDEAFAELMEALGASNPAASYLASGEIAPERVEELFRAAADLFRAAPWRHMSDHALVRVDIPRLGVSDAYLSVIGAAGESFGALLFSTLHDFRDFSLPRRGAGTAAAARRVAVRSLSFDTRDELAPSLLEEIESHRWPVIAPEAYPVTFNLDTAAEALPVSADDVRIMTAVARAFVPFFERHRDLFARADAQPVQESGEHEGVTVTLTGPHIPEDETSPWAEVQALDAALIAALEQFATNRYGPDWLGFDPDEEDDDSIQLIDRWVRWTAEVDGTIVADAFFDEHAHDLTDEAREWLAAQRAAWMSVWEVVAGGRGAIEMRDLLTGERRIVTERLPGRRVKTGDALLARVVDHRGASVLSGMHARPLPRGAANEVVEATRTKLRLRKSPVPPARLRDTEIGWFLIDRWNEAAEDDDERHARRQRRHAINDVHEDEERNPELDAALPQATEDE